MGIALAISLLATPATARPERTYGWERPFAVSLHTGSRSPFGTGVACGLQLAAFARLRLPVRSMASSSGSGYPRGPFQVENQECNMIVPIGGCGGVGSTFEYRWKAALWREVELSLDRRYTGASSGGPTSAGARR